VCVKKHLLACCTNCGGANPASHRGCKVFQSATSRRKLEPCVKTSSTAAVKISTSLPKADATAGDTLNELFSLFQDFSTSDLLSKIGQALIRFRSTANFSDKISIVIDNLQQIFTACKC